ncbi:MAG TPA: response regulator [Polyangiales bacterium]|nr:response regulator [Polyangiales bacterium]
MTDKAPTRILVVEDSATQAQELSFLLETEGFRVEVARDGGSGLTRCLREPVDVVLSDVVMPEIDGYELCRRLKANPATAHIPVILLTSLADPMDIVHGLECGADNFITKPYEPEYLMGRLRRLLDNRTLRAQRKVEVGVDVLLMGKRFTINSEREQILDLLISTFEEVLRSRAREYEAKLSEETLRESHRFLQSALDALQSAIAILNENGEIISANAAWRRLAQARRWSFPNAGVGKSYASLCREAFGLEGEDCAKLSDGVNSVQNGSRERFQLEYHAWPHTDPRWFALSATRFEDRGQRLVAVEHGDITERKQLEHQFLQSQKMEAVGQLAGGVAHDFNNLLTVITGYSVLLQGELPKDDPKRADLDEIVHAVETGAALTRQLLTFSRKQVFKPTVIDINQAITELERMLRRLIGEDIDYCTVLEPSIGRVRADPNQVQQILMNLVVNARDAMPHGGKLTVETANALLDPGYASSHPNVRPGNYVMLTVSDNGQGMDLNTQAHIFEPFFTTKAVGKGTGLGLSTVYGIVQQSGGHVWVYSEPGFGTTFRIYLPRIDERPAQTATDSQSKRVVRPPSETVLVVEDNDAVRIMLCRILRALGYRVIEAPHAKGALEQCERAGASIDLLISDVVMPDMSGLDLAYQLRTVRPGLRVLLMSGYSGLAVTRHGELGTDLPFLQKPFNPDTVARKVREVLENERMQAQSAR